MSSQSLKTAVLLIGFGGPQSTNEVEPFLRSVFKGTNIPEQRFHEVFEHYKKLGGVSRYNEYTERQRAALEKWLVQNGHALLVKTAYLHSHPSLDEVAGFLKEESVKRVIGFVLSVFRSAVSFEKYTGKLPSDIEVRYTPSFYNHPLFIEAQAEELAKVLKDGHKTKVIFSAHSIPKKIADQCRYAEEFAEASKLVAGKAGLGSWETAYQSRSGRPDEPWLGPDIASVIGKIDRDAFKNALLVPIGFLCDNAEVVYDLDMEAKKISEGLGLHYFRASTVIDHPKFIQMMGKKVLEALNG